MSEQHVWNLYHFLLRWAEKYQQNEIILLEDEIRERKEMKATFKAQENRLEKIKKMTAKQYVETSPLVKRLKQRGKELMKVRKAKKR